MIVTPWDQIDADVLQAFCDAGEGESATLDFKRIAPNTQRDDPKNEFAKDVCAFANANGGDLVYGVGAVQDQADHLTPLMGESADALKRRLSQVLANHVEPRIAAIRFLEVPIDARGFALVVRVPRSFDGPHRFHVRERAQVPAHHRFVMRSDTGTLDMDYAQLSDAFGRTAALVKKARAFRSERLARIGSGARMSPLASQPMVCIHLLPLAGMANRSLVDIALTYDRRDIDFAFAGGFVAQKQPTVDGLQIVAPADPQTKRVRCWIRLFRSGAMEVQSATYRPPVQEDGGPGFIPAGSATREIRRLCQQLLDHARLLGLEGPALLGLAAFDPGPHPHRFATSGEESHASETGQFELPDHWVDELSLKINVDAILRPLLDEYWQCIGWVQCDIYDDDEGKWNGPR